MFERVLNTPLYMFLTQPEITSPKLTIEALKQGVKYVHTLL